MRAFQPLDLDFAHPHRRVPAAGLALLLVAGLLALYAGWLGVRAYTLRASEQRKWEASQERLAQARHGADRPSVSPLDQKKLRHAMLIAEKLHTPWPALLRLLETVPMENVALLTIAPGSSAGQILIGGEAKDFEALLRYLAAMQSQAGLGKVSLLSHQIVHDAAGTPLRFQLQARWQQAPARAVAPAPQPLAAAGLRGTQ